jgi:N4-gp56 family major capsid protein
MALTTVTTNLKEQVWDNDFFAAYVRKNRFNRYMGTDENSVIQLKQDLSKKAGDRIHLALIAELSGAGVTGDTLLEGAEEALSQYEFPIAVSTLRNAVAVTLNQEQFTGIDIRNAGKTMLQNWAMKKLRTDIIAALSSIYVSGTGNVAYGSASEGQKDTWIAANSDRVMIGDGTTAAAFTDHSADLALVTSSMTLTKEIVSKMKAKAEAASPIVRPVTVGEDSENYVMFVGSGAFRDLKADLAQTLRDAEVRGSKNPLFQDGDLEYDGVVIRKIQEIPAIGTVGASSARVEPTYLCGAQALGVAWAQRTRSATEERDYGFVHGVAIHEMRGVELCNFNSKMHGVVRGYIAALAV